MRWGIQWQNNCRYAASITKRTGLLRRKYSWIGKKSQRLIKVVESRPISNKIAEDLNVKHESPQMIYIVDKTKYWATSHWSVTKAHMTAVLFN